MKNLFTCKAGVCSFSNAKHFQVKINRSFLSYSFFFILLMCFGVQSQAQKTWVAAASGNWSVAANWSGGTVPLSTDNVVLSPAAARTITVDGNYTVNNLTVGTNATLTLSSTFTLTVNGNFSQSSGTFNTGTGVLDVKGLFSKTAGTFNQGTGLLSFSGSGAQTISTNDATRTFYNLTVSNSAGLTIIAPATNLTISNNLNLTNGGLSIGANTLTLNGTVSSMSIANSITGSASSNITIGGSGTLGTLFFNASVPGTSNQLNNFIINRNTSGIVSLGNDLNIKTTLTLTNGIIQTGSGKLIVNATGTVGRTNGYVQGNLQKNVATGATSRTFEIGDAANYIPVTITFASVTAAGDLVVSANSPISSQPNTGTVYLDISKAVNRYWDMISVNTLVFTTYSATFNFVAGDLLGGVSTGSLKAAVYNSGWVYPTMGTLNATNSSINNVSVLGSVILASCAAPASYTVTGGGAYCSGSAGTAVGLNGSESGVNYQLKIGAVNTGSPVAGTGAAISFGNQTTAGTYTVVATRTATGCTATMTGSATVSINPLPTVNVSGTTVICSGTSSLALTYSNPLNGPDQYSIVWGTAASAAGFTDIPFTTLSGGTINIPGLLNTPGNYPLSILIKNSTTGCQTNITNGTVCGTVAENATLTLTAPFGNTFTGINFASYGLPSGTCGAFSIGSCHATTSMSVVQAAGIGQSSFSVAATNGVFGDPCVGTVKSLSVEAVYGYSITISPPLTANITGTSTICSGSSTTLTSPVAPSYAWSTGETTQSITVSPTSTTTYSVTISNGGCISVGSKTVTVNDLPSISVTNVSPSVCSGTNSVAINYTSPLNSPDLYSVTWSAAGLAAGLTNVNLAALSGGVINITGITNTAGVYPATITIKNSTTGCLSIIASGSICNTVNEGNTLNLSAPGGAKFTAITFASYGTPNGTCGGFTTGSCHAANSLSLVQAAALNNTSFSIAATNAVFGDPCNGTVKRLYVEAVYSIFALTVKAIPATATAGSNSPVCSGNSINLTASNVTGASYSWSGPNSFSSSSQNPTITGATVAMAGTYSVTTTIAGCSSATTGNIGVVVNPAPTATISYSGTPFCGNATSQPVSLTGTTGGAFSAPVALNINSSTGVINPSLSTVGGPYTVTYTIAASGGCSLFTTTTTVTVISVPTATTVTGGGTFCGSKLISASGGTGGTIYFQGTTSGGTSTAIASTSQTVNSSGTYYFRSRNASGCWGAQGSVTVTINPNPTCTGANLSTFTCSGGGATVNLTGLVSSSTNNTISYSINGVAQTPVTGINADAGGNASFSTATVTTANNGHIVRVTNIANGSCSTAFAYDMTLSITTAGTWLGINNNWNDAQNWCGGVPASTANVSFPAGRNSYPTISTGTIEVNNLTIASGASVTVNNAILKINGSISNTGSLTISSGSLELGGTSGAQTIAGSMFTGKTIKNLRISNSNGVSFSGVNDTLKITGLLDFGTSNAILNTNNNLTLVSNAAGTASVGDMTSNGLYHSNNIIGNATVERYIPNHPKAWQFLAAPTTGQTIKDAWQEGNTPLANVHPGYGTTLTGAVAGAVSLGFDFYTPSGASMKSYNPATNAWDGVTSPLLPIANKRGYMFFVRGDRSVTTSSAPATTTVLRTTGKLYTIGADAPPVTTVLAGKFESIANPYASAIDFTLLTKPSAPNLDDLFYVWDPLLNNNLGGLGGYQTMSALNDWKPVPGGTSNYDENIAYPVIQSGQAFMVHASGAGGNVSFQEACKTNGSSLVNRNVNRLTGRQFLKAKLYNSVNALSDGNIIAFDADLSNDYDANDALKVMNTGENFGVKHLEKNFSIEARNLVQTEDTVFYNLGNMRIQNYKLKFAPENMDNTGLTALLIDRYLNNMTPVNLSDSSIYQFSVTADPASAAANRLYLVLKTPVVLPVTFTSIAANRNSDKSIAVNWKVENETSMQLYTIERSADGRNFHDIISITPTANNGGTARYTNNDANPLPADNFYRVRALSLTGMVQYSSIVKVSTIKNTSGISIYPNPVAGNSVDLRFTEQTAGEFQITLIHGNGMQQPLTLLKIPAGQSSHSIPLKQQLASGIYYLRVTGPDGNTTYITMHVIN